MTWDIAYVLAVTAAALVVFVREWFAPDAVAIGILLLLIGGHAAGLGGIAPDQAFAAFGNPAVVTVAAMFVLSAGLSRTGAVAVVGRRILAFGGGSEARILVAMMAAVAVSSAFVNNTLVAALFLPIVLGIAESSAVPASKLLIPMSYASIVGGMCTVVGTSTNVLVSEELASRGLPRVAMFAPLPLALAGIAMTVAYMAFVGRRFLPVRATVTSTLASGRIRDYVTELVIPRGSPLAGKTLAEAVLARAPTVRVLQHVRGEEILPTDRERALAEDDVLIVKGGVNELLTLRRQQGLAVVPELVTPDVEARSRDTTLAELLVRPTSPARGERVRDLGLHARYGVVVLAVQRHGAHLREKVADLKLRFGDVLLVQTDAEALERLHDSEEFQVLEGVQERVILSERSWIAMAVMAGVVALGALEMRNFPVSVLAIAGALVMVGGGCLTGN